MRIDIKQSGLALAATSAMVLSGAGVADAATHGHKRHGKAHHARLRQAATTTTGSSSTPTTLGQGTRANGSEAELTGTTAQQASDAALAAVPGGTVDRASAEDPYDTSGAAYEVQVTKSDGTRVQVLEDSSFKVLSVGPGHGCSGHGGPNTSGANGSSSQQGTNGQ